MSPMFALKKIPFKRAGSLPKVKEYLWKASCFTSRPVHFVFSFVWDQRRWWAPMESLTLFLGRGFFQNSAREKWKEKKILLIHLNQLLSAKAGETDERVIGFACFTYTWCPNYDSDGLYSCLWQDLAATVRFINILMISWAPRSLVSGTNRYSQVTKKISSEWINFSCCLHFGCSQTTIVLLGFILLVPHEFSAVKSTYSSELSYMRSATLEHKDWMQASHVGAVASFV